MADVKHRDTRRRFEQWARNPHCEANAVSAVHGIKMADVARSEGIEPTFGQSPFAIARGQAFERGLFAKGAAKMKEALGDAGVLPTGEAQFVDLRLRQHGGPLRDQDEARAQTSALLTSLAAGNANNRPPLLIAGATIVVPGGVMLPEALLVLDALVALRNDSPPMLRVGEVKTYPDRGGYTDSTELATTRAQAGVYVHGLRLVLNELGIGSHVRVSSRGFLVLTKPGYNIAKVRADEDLEFQAKRAERGFARLRAASQITPRPDKDNPVEAVQRAATHYCDACVRFCDRASLCQKRALEAGDPAVLGDDSKRLLGETSLHRAVALLRGDKPRDPAERDLARRLREAEPLRRAR
jgi:hypothetical protein